jgi:hypothetical protein
VKNKHLAALAALSIPALLGSSLEAGAAPSCMPKLEGPIAITATSKPYEPSSNPYAGPTPPAGQKEEEFIVSCDASTGHYRTVIHVTMPTDPAKQSGIVIAEPWHPGDFWTIYDKARPYITRAGHVSIAIVSSNFVLSNFLKKSMPERYAGLSMPGPAGRGNNGRNAAGTSQGPEDQTQSEVLGQVGALIKSGGVPGVKARKVILGGMSATGGVTRAYIAYEHAKPGAKSVYDGYFPEQSALPSYPGPLPDLDVPVVELQGEREMIVAFERGFDKLRFMRADGPLYRLYEVPGMPHIATRMASRLPGDTVPTNKIEPGVADCTEHEWTNFPTDMVFGAALDALVKWVDKGIPAPHVPLIQTSADYRTITRDQYGNALGGFRTSYVDVPIAQYRGTWGSYTVSADGKPSDAKVAKCEMIGWNTYFGQDKLKALYPSHADYVAKVKKSTADLVARRLLLPEDAATLNQEAEKSAVAN